MAGTVTHYWTSVRIAATNIQAANSRILSLRNKSTNGSLLVVSLLQLRALQVAAGTAQENSLDAYKCTGFTASDTVNTVTPAGSAAKTLAGIAYPGPSAEIRHLTLVGAAAGMTGGTLAKDTQFFATMPFNISAAVNNAAPWTYDCLRHHGEFVPLTLAANEGIIVENSILNGTYGMTWYIDIGWADCPAF